MILGLWLSCLEKGAVLAVRIKTFILDEIDLKFDLICH